MSITWDLVSFEPGGVLPYGWDPYPGKWGGGIMGHEFTMVGLFKVSSKFKFGKGKSVPSTFPALIWREKEFWWERNSSGGWDYKGENDKGDLYQTAPGSPTWGGFRQGKGDDVRAHTWIDKPGVDVASDLHGKLFNGEHRMYITAAQLDVQRVKNKSEYQALERRSNTRGNYNDSMIKMWWMIAEKMASEKRRLPCAALDRPGMALSGGSGASGGGFKSLTTSESRRRVLQFDLGIVGSSQTYTATQVLETQNAQPSISKFFMPGKSDDWVKRIPEKYLEYWRSRLNPANVEDQTYELETEDTVNRWVEWVQQLEKANLV